jgi:hypothetical protein
MSHPYSGSKNIPSEKPGRKQVSRLCYFSSLKMDGFETSAVHSRVGFAACSQHECSPHSLAEQLPGEGQYPRVTTHILPRPHN